MRRKNISRTLFTYDDGVFQIMLLNELLDIFCHGCIIMYGILRRISMISCIKSIDGAIQILRESFRSCQKSAV